MTYRDNAKPEHCECCMHRQPERPRRVIDSMCAKCGVYRMSGTYDFVKGGRLCHFGKKRGWFRRCPHPGEHFHASCIGCGAAEVMDTKEAER